MNSTRRFLTLGALLFFTGPVVVRSQPNNKYSRPPDVANASYGPSERNVLDLWKANSSQPTPVLVFIHGGGFRGGSKQLGECCSMLPPVLLDLCVRMGVSVASIDYRLSDQALAPAAMLDGARAVQFLRFKAKEWNLNPKAFAATGGSAGAVISLWVGFHDDMAKPHSADPVERQSTRLSSMAVVGAQSILDPRVLTKLVGESAAHHPALAAFYGVGPDGWNTERLFRLYEETSPITYLTADDPPVFLYYGMANDPIPPDASPDIRIHHPHLGFYLKERMDRLGIECVIHLAPEYGQKGSGPGSAGRTPVKAFEQMVEFYLKHFPQP
jgi:acetyl esterase/lipase